MSRPRVRDHVCVGMRVISTDSLQVYRVKNLWDRDRQAQLVNRDGARLTVMYADLFNHFECVQPFGETRRVA